MSMLREHEAGLFRAVLASILLHAILLLAIPAPEAPVGAAQVRLRARLLLRPVTAPVADSRISAAPALTRPQAVPAKPGRVTPRPRPKRRRASEPLVSLASSRPELAQSSPVELPLSPEQQGALRGLRISLALALGGPPPETAVSCRAVARMRYLAGGRLAALSLAESDCPGETERWLIARLNRAVEKAPVPPALRPQALEIELLLELETDRTGREEP
ncbi:hypothetical protein [Niveibacterium terrae]|uniref:hypothetical protein n=1 Tax=Niveibacterium terrae TaxID=3373598 RepID=UPI003A91CE9F